MSKSAAAIASLLALAAVVWAATPSQLEFRSVEPSNHVIAGDILSPGTTDRIAGQILDFILRPAR